jgi:hypothetical protein
MVMDLPARGVAGLGGMGAMGGVSSAPAVTMQRLCDESSSINVHAL